MYAITPLGEINRLGLGTCAGYVADFRCALTEIAPAFCAVCKAVCLGAVHDVAARQ
jgi:hypothetical protein